MDRHPIKCRIIPFGIGFQILGQLSGLLLVESPLMEIHDIVQFLLHMHGFTQHDPGIVADRRTSLRRDEKYQHILFIILDQIL